VDLLIGAGDGLDLQAVSRDRLRHVLHNGEGRQNQGLAAGPARIRTRAERSRREEQGEERAGQPHSAGTFAGPSAPPMSSCESTHEPSIFRRTENFIRPAPALRASPLGSFLGVLRRTERRRLPHPMTIEHAYGNHVPAR
jgi:hypothetical protein